MKAHYETPDAVVHDFRTLLDDARALVVATSESTDDKVTAARRRLEAALESGKGMFRDLQEHARESLDTADACVRRHPYESLAVALGVGALLGHLLSRRS